MFNIFKFSEITKTAFVVNLVLAVFLLISGCVVTGSTQPNEVITASSQFTFPAQGFPRRGNTAPDGRPTMTIPCPAYRQTLDWKIDDRREVEYFTDLLQANPLTKEHIVRFLENYNTHLPQWAKAASNYIQDCFIGQRRSVTPPLIETPKELFI